MYKIEEIKDTQDKYILVSKYTQKYSNTINIHKKQIFPR